MDEGKKQSWTQGRRGQIQTRVKVNHSHGLDQLDNVDCKGVCA